MFDYRSKRLLFSRSWNCIGINACFCICKVLDLTIKLLLIYPLMFSPFKHRGIWVVINLNHAAHFLHFMAIFICPSAPWLYMYGLAKHCTHRVFVYASTAANYICTWTLFKPQNDYNALHAGYFWRTSFRYIVRFTPELKRGSKFKAILAR